MPSLAPIPQLPEPFVFADEAAPLRFASPPLSPREEVRLHVLANEIARYAPALAQRLAHRGLNRLRAELAQA